MLPRKCRHLAVSWVNTFHGTKIRTPLRCLTTPSLGGRLRNTLHEEQVRVQPLPRGPLFADPTAQQDWDLSRAQLHGPRQPLSPNLALPAHDTPHWNFACALAPFPTCALPTTVPTTAGSIGIPAVSSVTGEKTGGTCGPVTRLSNSPVSIELLKSQKEPAFSCAGRLENHGVQFQ